jgi:hypothetical protein
MLSERNDIYSPAENTKACLKFSSDTLCVPLQAVYSFIADENPPTVSCRLDHDHC